MTDLIERAITAARGMPPVMEDEIARMVLGFAGDEQPACTSRAQEAAEQDAADVAEVPGDDAMDQEVRAIWPGMAIETAPDPHRRAPA